MNFTQHVTFPTHVNGHILDLILSPLTSEISIDHLTTDSSVSSDHFAVLCNLRLPKPQRKKKEILARRWRSVDTQAFNTDIINRVNSSDHSTPLSLYNEVLKALLDFHAPLRRITITERPSTPWYSSEIRHEKTKCRHLERKWFKSKLTIDHELYKKPA
jgi:hypothetical protein